MRDFIYGLGVYSSGKHDYRTRNSSISPNHEKGENIMVFCPICKEELVEPTPKGDYHKFLVPSKCKNNHKFMVAIVAGHLSIGGDYIRVLRRGDKMKEHRIFICDGHADDIEVQQTIDWISEDPENRTATIRPSTPLPSSIG